MKSINMFGLLGVAAACLLIGLAAGRVSAQGSASTGQNAEYAAALPDDVHPESRNRLPLVKREELDEETRKIFDGIVSDPRSLAGLQGPGGIRLNSPRLAQADRGGAQYLRFETDLGRRLSELAILVAAREMDQQFEWTVHEPAALREGLEPAIIDIVRDRQPLQGLGEKESAIIQLGREAVGHHRVSPQTFARALKVFGPKTLTDLAYLMGQYAATAVVLTTFDQQLPPGQKPLLPIP